MGGKSSKKIDEDKIIKETAKSLNMSIEEVEFLFGRYKNISSLMEDDGLIDKQEFCAVFDSKLDSPLAMRLFNLLDENGDHFINFIEFAKGMRMLSPQSDPEDKLKFSFKFFDLNGDGFISREELSLMLKHTLAEKRSFTYR